MSRASIHNAYPRYPWDDHRCHDHDRFITRPELFRCSRVHMRHADLPDDAWFEFHVVHPHNVPASPDRHGYIATRLIPCPDHHKDDG